MSRIEGTPFTDEDPPKPNIERLQQERDKAFSLLAEVCHILDDRGSLNFIDEVPGLEEWWKPHREEAQRLREKELDRKTFEELKKKHGW